MTELSVIVTAACGFSPPGVCLAALARQELDPGAAEVVVLHGAAGARVPRLPFPVRVLPAPRDVDAARDAGVAQAAGRVVLFLDAGVVPAPGLLAEHLAAHMSGPDAVALGPIAVRGRAHDGLRRHLAEAERGRCTRLAEANGSSWWLELTSVNLSLPRAALLAAGGFGPPGGARGLGRRLAHLGLRCRALATPVTTGDAPSFRAAARAARDAGRADAGLAAHAPAALSELPLACPPSGRLRARLAGRLLANRVIPLRALAAPARVWPDPLLTAAYWRGVRGVADRDTWRRLRRGTAILMYHGLGTRGEPPSRFVVPARRFRRHMAWLRWSRWRVIGLERYLDLRARHELPPPRSVVITFDDGYADTALARDVLERHRFPATVFVVSDCVGGRSSWELDRPEAGALARRAMLGWPELRELARAGVELGAHSRTHARLTRLAPAELEEEVRGARAALELGLGRPVTTFAYPYGDQGPDVRRAAARGGLKGAVGVRAGLNGAATCRYDLRRLEIRGTDSLLGFALTLWSGDRWLGDRLARRR